MKPRLVKISDGPAHGGWRAKIRGQEPLVADTVDQLAEKVRGVLGDRSWVWKPDLGEDSDWYILLVDYELNRRQQGLLANDVARSRLADAVWAVGLDGGSKQDAASLMGVPLDWVERVYPGPGEILYDE